MEKVVLLVLGVFAAQAAAQYSCTEEHLNSCLGDMLAVATSAQAGGIPSYTPDEFKKVCVQFKASSRCFNAIRSNCAQASRMGMDAVKLMFDYLCEEGFTAFVNNSDCFLNEDLKTRSAKCTSDYQDDVNSLKYVYGSQEAKMNKLCGYSRDMVDCTARQVGKHCSTQAVHLIRKMSKLVIEFTFDELNYSCHINTAVAIKTGFLSLLLTAMLIIRNYL